MPTICFHRLLNALSPEAFSGGRVALGVSGAKHGWTTGPALIHAVHATNPHLLALIITGFANANAIPVELVRLAKPFRQSDLIASLKLARSAAEKYIPRAG